MDRPCEAVLTWVAYIEVEFEAPHLDGANTLARSWAENLMNDDAVTAIAVRVEEGELEDPS